MSLMSLVRWIGVVVIAWTLVAIGLGASGTRLEERDLFASRSPEAASLEAMPANWPDPHGFDLVDRADGRRTSIRLPEGEQWAQVSVSPWRGPGGELVAAGRWVNPHRDDFSGWGVFRVSDGAMLSRVATEVLPTGPPCWVPGVPRMILFAAADGQLCRLQLSSSDEAPVVHRAPIYASGRGEPSEPVVWEVASPGPGHPVVTDPVWPVGPRFGHLVFAAIMTLEGCDKPLQYGPNRLFWLELSDDASRIVAAGPLIDPAPGDADVERLEQRFPNIAVGADGRCQLVFLERRSRKRDWRLRTVPLEFDAKTGRPHASGSRITPAPDASPSLEPAPLLLSVDGSKVFGIAPTGQLGAWSVRTEGAVHEATASR
jgi:hypothetical protein